MNETTKTMNTLKLEVNAHNLEIAFTGLKLYTGLFEQGLYATKEFEEIVNDIVTAFGLDSIEELVEAGRLMNVIYDI
jgi:hypothetical protein